MLGVVVDPGCQGKLKVVMHHGGKESLTCQAGQHIAQLICEKCSLVDIRAMGGPGEAAVRGHQGLGSTDEEMCNRQKAWAK